MLKFTKYFLGFVVLCTVIFLLAYNSNLYIWEEPKNNIWITGGELFDGTAKTAHTNPGILILDGKIACLGASCEVPGGVTRITAAGKSIVPGLIELHGHFFGGRADSGEQSMPSMIWNSIRLQPNVRRKLIESGITSYRSVGDPSSGIFDLKKQIGEQSIAGPRIFISGPIFTVPGGHPVGKVPGWMADQMIVQSDDPEYVKKQVLALLVQGVDGIKIVHQEVKRGEITIPAMSIDTLKAITSEAHKHGLWIAVHTGSPKETAEAIKAGITTIEHGVRHGNHISPEILQLIVDHNIIYVPTLAREPKGHINIPALHLANVKFGVGTDTQGNMIVGESYHNELLRMVDAGLPDSDALLAATKNGAEALGMKDQLGTIEVGKIADLIVVNGKPWQDIRDLKNVELVVLAGRIALNKLN